MSLKKLVIDLTCGFMGNIDDLCRLPFEGLNDTFYLFKHKGKLLCITGLESNRDKHFKEVFLSLK